MTVEFYKDAAGRHRWRLRADNGNIVADSGQSYARLGGAHSGWEAVRRAVRNVVKVHHVE